MEVVHAHCAGLDVHKDTVVACVRHMTDGKVTTTIKTFNTATQELLALSDWLSAENATHIAMEATGVYWKPVWNILSDGEFELVLGNAAHHGCPVKSRTESVGWEVALTHLECRIGEVPIKWGFSRTG